MKTSSFLFVLIIAFLACSFKFQNSDNKIYWTKDVKLIWDNYKGIPEENREFGAITKCGYGYKFATQKDSITILATCYFNPNKSWVKENSKTNNLLNHEQCHFDLAELYARKFREQISSFKFNSKTAEETIEKIFNDSYYIEYSKAQDEYDKETDFSRNHVKQLEWEKKIAKELKDLETYSKTKITLHL